MLFMTAFSAGAQFGLKSNKLIAAPAEWKPCPAIEIERQVTANNSSQPAYEASIKNVAGTTEAEIEK